MNILFLTMNVFTDIEMHNIYSDLMKEFIKHGHRPYIVTPREKRTKESTQLVEFKDYGILKIQIGNTSNVCLIKKGISMVTLSSKYYKAVKKNLGHLNFKLILYSTPPITFEILVKDLKRLWNCKTYLMLKDIFPQNAVDLKMFSKNSVIYKFFRNKEKKLYEISDYIGCMSQANVDYVIKNNPKINPDIVEVCPNSIEVVDLRIEMMFRDRMREKYGIPLDKKVFLYGGNLGKPQGIPDLIRCLKSQVNNPSVYFLIVGDGTEFSKLRQFFYAVKPVNMKLMRQLPKQDYDQMAAACDVGMIFLDHKFTIPNFPSRLLSYLQVGIPVLACTDKSTDIGSVIVNGGFGWWCESDDVEKFSALVEEACKSDLKAMGNNGYRYLEEKYSADRCYDVISKSFK